MFEDNNTPAGAAPKNLPIAEPEDIFGDVDKDNSSVITADPAPVSSALSAGVLKKKVSDTTSPISPIRPVESSDAPSPITRVSTYPRDEVYPTKEPVLGKIFIVLIIIAAAAGLGYGAWLFYLDYTEETPQETVLENNLPTVSTPESESVVTIPETTVEEEVEEKSTDDVLIITQPADDDNDNLSNERELELGTNPRVADTDEDGLRDGDEVIIWSTNPLNPDSDGDGYKDGEEVINGYNPLGPGKLGANNLEGEDI